ERIGIELSKVEASNCGPLAGVLIYAVTGNHPFEESGLAHPRITVNLQQPILGAFKESCKCSQNVVPLLVPQGPVIFTGKHCPRPQIDLPICEQIAQFLC